MNYSTAVMLVNPKIRAILTIYQPIEKTPNQGKYMFKTLDPDLKVGDLVLVPSDTRFGFTVNKIVEVDAEVDFDSSVQVKWIAAKVDVEQYESIVKMEAEMIDAIRTSENHKKRETMKNNMFAAMDAGVLQNLQIAQIGNTPAAEPVEPVKGV